VDIDGMLRPHAGLYGCTAAAPPLLWLSRRRPSALRSKWFIPGGAATGRRRGQSPIWRRWTKGLIAFCLLFKGSSCKCVGLFSIFIFL
jgi:hypothetical protein